MMRSKSSLVIDGATIIDGVSDKALQGRAIWAEGDRIKAIGIKRELPIPSDATVIDATGKYVIPGLLNANVHLFGAYTLERLARHLDNYEDLIAEAAQVSLKSGVTTVFDTWGPRRFLISTRNQINEAKSIGSRIFCAGNIIGFDGPLSADFFPKGLEAASASFVRRVNSIWVENVGRHLMWLTPAEVGKEVRKYVERGIDFLKYGSNEHGAQAAGAFLAFSPRVQRVIVNEAHGAGLTAQAHCTSVEGLRCAIDAGCDLITHCNITGPTPIPEETLELFATKNIGAVVFPSTQRRLEWFFSNVSHDGLGAELMHTMCRAADTNVRNLIRMGAPLLMGTDGLVFPPEYASDPHLGKWLGVDNHFDLAEGHFFWLKAMEEKGCAPMEMLRAATRNIALAYKKDGDLGTLQAGKKADIVILDDDPLASVANYRKIHTVVKDGALIDRDALPSNPVLTAAAASPDPEEASYVPFLAVGTLPPCPMCSCGLMKP